jgi:plastocyanin
MRKLILLPLAVAALVIGASAPAATNATKTVSITRTAFVPKAVSILTNDSVTWTNSDTIDHQVVSQSASFASPILHPGDTYDHVFPTAGKFSFKDALSTKTGTGTVTVSNPPVTFTLSLTASGGSVVYGVTSLTLSGKLAPAKTGQTVTLNAQPVGETTAKALQTTSTAADGTYSFTVSPTIRTVFSTAWQSGADKAASPSLTVNVHPRVGLGLRSHLGTRFTYRAKVTSDISYQGHVAFFQRWSPSLGAWISLKRVFLGSTSAATFSVRLRPHLSKVRVFLPATQAGSGYISGVSRSLLAIR